jgi:hypothetical protein
MGTRNSAHPRVAPRELRKRAGVPLIKAAADANVSETTARVYEIDRDEVKDPIKRAALDRVYGQWTAVDDGPEAA